MRRFVACFVFTQYNAYSISSTLSFPSPLSFSNSNRCIETVSEHRISLLTASLLEMSNRDIKLVRKYMHSNANVLCMHCIYTSSLLIKGNCIGMLIVQYVCIGGWKSFVFAVDTTEIVDNG